MEIREGMYGLKQARRIANDRLGEELEPYGYYPTRHTPGLWVHKIRPIQFALVVDNFGIKYVGKKHAQHLLNVLKKTYEMTEDWNGKLICGIHFKWDYNNSTVEMPMPKYVTKALEKLGHTKQINKCTHHHHKSLQDEKERKELMKETPLDLTEEQKKRLQNACGLFLYHLRAVDPTMMHALNDLPTAITRGTQETMKALNQFLDYCGNHSNAIIRYHASDMVKWIHSDAGYNNTTKARSRDGGHFYLGNFPDKKYSFNGPIMTLANVIKNAMSSATEAELAMYMNAKEAVPIRNILEELGHKQPPTAIVTGNAVAEGIINKTVKQQKSKSMDMRFY